MPQFTTKLIGFIDVDRSRTNVDEPAAARHGRRSTEQPHVRAPARPSSSARAGAGPSREFSGPVRRGATDSGMSRTAYRHLSGLRRPPPISESETEVEPGPED